MPRILTLFLLLAALLWPLPAQAQGNGNGNGNGQDKQDQDNGKGSDNGNGQGNGNGNGQDNGNGQRNDDAAPRALSESETQAAVQSGSIVALETLLPDLRSRTGGELIDARLVRISGFLVYEVKALSPQGHVSTEYYYARSGSHVER